MTQRISSALKLLLMCGLLVLCIGCADNNKMRGDLVRLQNELDSLRSVQAEQTSALAGLRTEARSLAGRIDELEYAQKQRLGSSIDSLRSDLTTLRKRVPPPPIVPVDVLESDEAGLESFPRELSGPFSEALGEIRAGEFERAQSLLDDSLAIALGTDWAATILFWRAVACEGRNDLPGALRSYHEIITQFPRNDRVPTSLLRQASVLIRLNDKKAARATLTKLISNYPKSEEAKRARERLKDL